MGQRWYASSKFPPVASTHKKKKEQKKKNKTDIFSDEVQGSISQEALHFHLGAKWF